MLLSISLILILGMFMGWICQKIKLPSLLGMLITGIVLGPYVLNLLDDSILGISAELRKIALIIILTRAGLGLDLSGLKKIGRPAVLMCFVPASFELIGMILLAPKLMGLTVLEAAIMGAVLAAVSPAVVVPRMVKLMDEGYGVNEGILAGASVDDVYVIVLFSTFVGMMQGEGASILKFVNIPISIFLGIAIGLLIGVLLAYFFKKMHIRDTSKVLIILSISFLLVVMEDKLFSIDRYYVYRHRITEKEGNCCKKTFCKIWKAMGCGRSLFVCACRSNGKHRIPWKSRSEGSDCYYWCIGI